MENDVKYFPVTLITSFLFANFRYSINFVIFSTFFLNHFLRDFVSKVFCVMLVAINHGAQQTPTITVE